MENIFLCAYVVSDEKIDIAPLKEFLFQQLPEYMIPAHIVQVEAIPLTPNGKVDRKILPDPDFEMKFAAPRDETGKKLAEIWAEVLKIEKTDISIDHNFFQLGGHSLRATVLAVKIQKEFNVELTVEDIFTLTTIRQLSEYIKKDAGKKKFLSIEAVEKKEYYPLSSAQKRLFFIQQMLPESIAYNLTQVFVLKGKFGRDRWERTFTKLIKRHESLRTSLEMIKGEPAQKIKEMDELGFEIEYFDVEKEEEKVIKNFVRPFDLSVPSLLRVGLVNTGKTNPIMIVDMHHIISDGVSHGSLIRDFFILYSGEQLPPLRLQYKDYAEWQGSDKQNEALMRQEEYWLKRFEGGIPELKMFTDYARPARENFEADYISFELGKELSRDLNGMVKETGTTLFILLLAVYNILLSKYTGQEDIIVGSTIAGRNHADLEHIIGIFVNLLAMRNRAEENKRFIDFLKEVKTNTIDAFENQDYPFDELVKKLGLERNWKRNPLFDTQFILQNLENERGDIEGVGLTFEPYNYKKTQSPFDLFLEATEINNTITLRLIYLTSLYKPSTVEYMSKHYIEILRQVAVNRDILLKDIRISHTLSAAQTVVSQKEVMEFEL
jgi:acyl carrier protein